MEKKTYIAPAVMVEVLETETLMLTASAGYEVDTEEQDFIQRGGSRRGTWGNFWAE